MPLQPAILSADDKRQIAASAFVVNETNADEGWEDAPEADGRSAPKGVIWEYQFGDLGQYRRYVGKYRKVLNPIIDEEPLFNADGTPLMDSEGNQAVKRIYNDKATKSLATSIKTRFVRVFPNETWSVLSAEDGIRMSFVGNKPLTGTRKVVQLTTVEHQDALANAVNR
jgi:hypothetical protein